MASIESSNAQSQSSFFNSRIGKFWPEILLIIFGTCSFLLYDRITDLSTLFGYRHGENGLPTLAKRPIPLFVKTMCLCFVIYMASYLVVTLGIRAAGIRKGNTLQIKRDFRCTSLAVMFAVAFRVIVCYSEPIQEVDIYRYIWDGAVTCNGMSPFKYPPGVIVDDINKNLDEKYRTNEVKQLAALCFVEGSYEGDDYREGTKNSLAEVVRRIHFNELPTVYPAVSQVVFAFSEFTTPANASVQQRVRIMRAWLVGLDILTMFLVIQLLGLCQMPRSHCLAYAWCPLVIKEFSNSGHLDSIAVFLTTLAVYVLVRTLTRESGGELSGQTKRIWHPWLLLAASVLALGTAAKLFSVVLVPVFCFCVARRYGIRSIWIPAIAFFVVSFLLLKPLLPTPEKKTKKPSEQLTVTQSNESGGQFLPAEKNSNEEEKLPPSNKGMSKFLKSWEMNDLVFMMMIENLKPGKVYTFNKHVWFSYLPDKDRIAFIVWSVQAYDNIVNQLAKLPFIGQKIGNWAFTNKDLDLAKIRSVLTNGITGNKKIDKPVGELPFLVTRAYTSILYLLLAIGIAAWACYKNSSEAFLQAAFLTIAWFWLLSPTQNPWYWTWAMPFLVFARGRSWLLVSGLAMLYYMRFWYQYNPSVDLPGATYKGASFFDFIYPWFEFAPVLLLLALEWPARLLSQLLTRIDQDLDQTSGQAVE